MAKPTDVDSYIADCAEEARPILEALRAIVKATIPAVEEGISWGVPFYRYHGALAGFAAYKNHVSFGLGAGVLGSNDRNQLERKDYKTGKRTIQVRFSQQVPARAIEHVLLATAKANEAERPLD